MENEVNEKWTEGELREFEGIEQKLINETLCWKKEAVNKIRAVYPGNSRTTKWRQKQTNIKLEEYAKGIKKIDTFFQPVSESIGMSNKSSSSTKSISVSKSVPNPLGGLALTYSSKLVKPANSSPVCTIMRSLHASFSRTSLKRPGTVFRPCSPLCDALPRL